MPIGRGHWPTAVFYINRISNRIALLCIALLMLGPLFAEAEKAPRQAENAPANTSKPNETNP
ncbi:MAG: hypothetical protein KDK33_04555, partial [Leptospiraceae bacterium]|nr:hypothetical protein [Leptospiraceae bacterium]